MKILKSIFNKKPYGDISDIEEYINYNYGNKNYKLTEIFSLEKYIDFHRAGEKSKGDCLLVAIATVMEFHKNIGRYGFPDNYDEIYKIVLKKANGLKAYPIPLRGGTTPLLANNIASRYLKEIGMKNYRSKNIYGIDWTSSKRKTNIILNEIRNLRPIVFNISSGYYKNHSITIIGYRIYENSFNDRIIILELADAWVKYIKYLNLNNFNTVSSITKIDPGF
ncbi:MAG: hypothetical protein Q4P31_03040 [Andreesenia angusta]|nr:hypothetical protein [Andreesenia angusta]